MTKEQFCAKWEYSRYWKADLEAVIATEIAKVQEVKAELATNPISEAYEQGLKIRRKNWDKNAWIQKLSETESTSDTLTTFANNWDFEYFPDKWELYTEPVEQPKPNVLNEQFSEVHHKIVDGLGTILSSLGANSGIMSIVMSWGDTQDSVSTLQMLNDYIEKYIDKKPANPFNKDRFEAMFRAVVASGKTESWKEDFRNTEIALEKLDAYYASKEGGNNE